MNDFLLILQMKQGNEKAFDKFVRKYYAEILSYCRYHCLDQAEAEDLTQETFLRFMENIASYQHIGKAKNFIYAKITFPVWSILFGLASCFLIGAVYKAIHDCNRLCSTMEGNLYEITNG